MKEQDQRRNRKPDWKNPKDYESMNELGLNQWAWEFLRRNSEYIKDWENFKVERFQDEHGNLKKGCLTLELKWGINSSMLLPNPYQTYDDKKNDPDGIGFFPPGGSDTVMLGKTKHSKKLLFYGVPNFKTGELNIEFNFLLPINPQIKIAKERLLYLQKRAKQNGMTTRKAFKPRRDEWILLVRILDAIAAGATDKEIASILFPSKCPVDETAIECPLDKPNADLLDDNANKCPLAEGSSKDKRCPLEDPSAGIKKVGDKKEQALRYVNHDYRHIPYSDK